MKIWIWSGERYPDYSFKTTNGGQYFAVAEVSPEQIEKWREIEDKYVAMQEELDLLYKTSPQVFE